MRQQARIKLAKLMIWNRWAAKNLSRLNNEKKRIQSNGRFLETSHVAYCLRTSNKNHWQIFKMGPVKILKIDGPIGLVQIRRCATNPVRAIKNCNKSLRFISGRSKLKRINLLGEQSWLSLTRATFSSNFCIRLFYIPTHVF